MPRLLAPHEPTRNSPVPQGSPNSAVSLALLKEESMKSLTALLITSALLTGCMTLSGTYQLSLQDADGQPLPQNINMTAQGSGIYSARNAMCSVHPHATVIIRDLESGEELKSESPYKC
jgi:uncharacterized lipoprotein YajG